MKFIKFETAEQLNAHLAKVDLNKIADIRSRRTEGGLYQFDALSLQMFVSDIMRETFYQKEATPDTEADGSSVAG